jgi:hypothetical protein
MLKQWISKVFALPFHPVLWGVYPVLALLAYNGAQTRASEALRSLFLAIGLAIVLFVLLRLILGDWDRAAILSSLWLVLFFTYGHVYQFLREISADGQGFGRHRYLVPTWALLFIIVSLWIFFKKNIAKLYTKTFNLMAVVLVLIPSVQILQWEARYRNAESTSAAASSDGCSQTQPVGRELPDIYYIILDAYTRADVLLDTYGYNNQAFIDALTEKGFYVATWSQSNYSQTELSLASSLNMDYLQNLGVNYGPGSQEREALWPLLVGGAVRNSFECLGYTIITVDSGYYWTGWRDADLYLSPELEGAAKLRAANNINAFETLLLNTTVGLILSEPSKWLPDIFQKELVAPHTAHQDRILYAFDAAENIIPELDGPKFVFIHLLTPHPPYVFDANGRLLAPKGTFTLVSPKEEKGYPEQVQFINQQMLQVVDGILAKSAAQPVIILQGDHGIGSGIKDKMSILNAYYLPEGGELTLYPTISPVNTFRIIFNTYFNREFELLGDISYYSTSDDMYNFTVYPNDHAK